LPVAPGGDYDWRNNAEQLQWTPDGLGLVELSVGVHRIVVGPRDFALVVTGDFAPVSPLTDADEDGLPDWWEHWRFGDLEPLPGDGGLRLRRVRRD